MCRSKVCPSEEMPLEWIRSGRMRRLMGKTLTTRSLLMDSWSHGHDSPVRELWSVDGKCLLPSMKMFRSAT